MAAANVGLAGFLRKTLATSPDTARFVSAAVLIPLVLLPTFFGHEWFVGLVVGVAAAAAWEAAALQARAGLPASPIVAVLLAVAIPVGVALQLFTLGWLLAGAALAVALFILGYAVRQRSPLGGWALTLAAGLYPGVLLAPAVALRERFDGLGLVLLIMAATWACDTTAYVIGRRWGRHKLAPAISPGKTVEGVAGGLVGGLVVGAIASLLLPETPMRIVGLGLVVAVAAILGDLAESAMKRRLGAKDSGWLVPGHGGLLDRIDGLLFGSFLGYLFIAITDGVFRA
jgi:phosphatidate cytidylyltransferase